MATSVFDGQGVHLNKRDDGFHEIVFDHKNSSVNKFDKQTLEDLKKVVDHLEKDSSLKGVLVRSAKDAFIVGADVTEFPKHFLKGEAEFKEWVMGTQKLFNRFEDLPVPTVAAIDGMCLGGGCEFVLSATYRVASEKARIGLPETKLGIFPGWGGCVRLPRIAGADNAIEWIATGQANKADNAYNIGVVEGVVESNKLIDSALDLLTQACDGQLDWHKKREEKLKPLTLISPMEGVMSFEGAKGFVLGKAGPNYPAPIAAIEVMQKGAGLGRDEAIDIEADAFTKIAHTKVAENLVGIFLSDQFNKKKTKSLAKQSKAINHAGVLGAGIMGGGIAYQSASKGVPILMKDIAPEALELGVSEATKLFSKLVERKKIDHTKMARGIAAITPTLSFGDFQAVDVVVEAIVENEKIKKSVLSDLESKVRPDAVLASNTSTISISRLAEGLDRPEQFCGMHFFNPVHRMPLVEVIRGEKTSDATIQKVVAYALQLGKTPVVVNDCPGFLVNRILFPYFFGLMGLIEDGADFKRIDKVMEKFGWPMGPAYLLDVIGIDTAVHAAKVMAQGFPERMAINGDTVMDAMVKENRLGQKNGLGFYQYAPDRKGKPKKSTDPKAEELVKKLVKNNKDISDEEIIERMMIPMINESALCLAEKIVETPMELDLGLLYGIGFPPFRGGALKYLDQWGVGEFVKQSEKYKSLGASYHPAPLIEKMAKEGSKFYQN